MSPRSRVLAAALLVACGERGAPAPSAGPLPPGVAARAGNETVTLTTVARIAAAQRVPPKQARERAVTDALFAAAVRADPAEIPRVRSAERAVLARAVAEGVRDETRALGPPSDAEVQGLTNERWPEFERPPSARTTHAVVRVKAPADDAPARELAATLAAALRGAADARDFTDRATKLPHGGLEVRAEDLPPVTADGRMWDPTDATPRPIPGTLDLDFARAAVALEHPGDQSGIVKTAFGYHVIRLEERYPAVAPSLAERRALLEQDIITRRGKRELETLKTRLRAQTTISIERAAEALTGLVAVEP